MDWLPAGKTAAVCFSIDDVHPAKAADGYDAGGDLGRGALGRLERLLKRHPQLHATLFVTPDWRPAQLVTKRFVARLPLVGRHVYHVDLHPRARYRLDRHPELTAYLAALPRTDVAVHGLHHIHRGPSLAVEFQRQSYSACRKAIAQGVSIFQAAGLSFVKGFAPPGWNLPPQLISALRDSGFAFVCSARDLRTPIRRDAASAMSGLSEVSLIGPEELGGGLVHIPTNFQATSDPKRAHEIVACNGLVSIKAHIFKDGGGHSMADGFDDAYCDFLDGLLTDLDRRYGDALWWPSLQQVAARAATAAASQTLAATS